MAYLQVRNIPRPSMDMTSSQSSGVASVIVRSGMIPAFATRTSRRPYRSVAAAIMRCASSAIETSPTTVTHSRPRESRSSRRRSSPAASMSVATSRAPSVANTSTVARPMPLAAPVMTADFPTSRLTSLLGVLDRAGLADHRHLDLTRVRQLLLDLAHDVAREAGRSEIVDLLGPDQDPHLAAGLDGERALDAF